MTITVVATVAKDGNQQSFSYGVSEEAQEAVRFKFNPSDLESVTRIKLLTSALVSEINFLKALASEGGTQNDYSGQEILSHARQLAVDASMNAVLAATKGL